MEGEIERGFELVVDRVDLLPGFFELQAAAEDLDAEVVFLIDHDGEGFVFADRHAAGALGVFVRAC